MNIIIKSKSKLRAFTLTELLVYLAIFGILFASMMQFLFYVERSSNKAYYRSEMDKFALFLDERLKEDLQTADSIDTVNSTFDDDAGVLVLSVGAANETFTVTNGTLTVDRGVGNSILTAPSYNVDRFYVERVNDNIGDVKGVRITIELSSRIEQDTFKTITNFYALPE